MSMKKLILTFSFILFILNSLCFGQWNLMNLGGGTTGPIISTKPGTLFAATGLGIYRSTNSALTWQNVCDSSVTSFWRSYPTIMVGRGDTVIFGSYGHVIGMARFYATTNNGNTWRLIEQGVRISSFIFKDNCWLYSCTRTGATSGLYRSTDLGTTWSYLGNTNLIKNLFVYNNFIYGTGTNGIFRSSDYGTNWEKVFKENIIPSVMGNMLISISSNAITKSTDGGFNWESSTITAPFTGIRSLTIKGTNIFVNDDWDFATYRSIDTGMTWTRLNTLDNQMSSLCVNGNSIYGAYDGVLRSTDNGLTWTRRNTGLTALTVYKIFADGRNIYASTISGLSISRNNGNSWTDVYSFRIPESWGSVSFTKAGANVFFATDSIVYRTSNNGYNWTEVYRNYSRGYPVLGSNNGNVYLFYENLGLFYSTNSGNNWSSIPYPVTKMNVIKFSGNSIYCGGDSGVYKTENSGQNWTKVNKNYFTDNVKDIEIINSIVYVATSDGIYKSSDNGVTWLNTNSPVYSGSCDIMAAGNKLYYSFFSGAVWVTTNEGTNWTQVSGDAGNRIYSLSANDNYLYCGTSASDDGNAHTSGIYRRGINTITNIQNESNLPTSYSIHQNYPNPFNPTTKIAFDIPKVSRVKIAIYDISGREVSVILNENLQAGTYERQWDGSHFSSGVYFYKITAGDFIQSKKMLLIK